LVKTNEATFLNIGDIFAIFSPAHFWQKQMAIIISLFVLVRKHARIV
jgi:hypothetical protein